MHYLRRVLSCVCGLFAAYIKCILCLVGISKIFSRAQGVVELYNLHLVITIVYTYKGATRARVSIDFSKTCGPISMTLFIVHRGHR